MGDVDFDFEFDSIINDIDDVYNDYITEYNDYMNYLNSRQLVLYNDYVFFYVYVNMIKIIFNELKN